ncbi:hypothetical protein S245_008998, partial [Arachis hypogaea]
CKNFIKLRDLLRKSFLRRSSSAAISSINSSLSLIDEICCTSIFYSVELCSAISPSPSSFIEHLG